MIRHTHKSGLRSVKAFDDGAAPAKRKRFEGPCDGRQVLLWIGSAIGIIISATWVMVNDKVKDHSHPDMAKQHDIQRVVDTQTLMQQKLDSLSTDIRNQTEKLVEMYERWQPRRVR